MSDIFTIPKSPDVLVIGSVGRFSVRRIEISRADAKRLRDELTEWLGNAGAAEPKPCDHDEMITIHGMGGPIVCDRCDTVLTRERFDQLVREAESRRRCKHSWDSQHMQDNGTVRCGECGASMTPNLSGSSLP